MRVAVFTDADFDRATNITTTLAALLRHAPLDVRPRIYSLSELEVDEPEYLTLRSPVVPLRFQGLPPIHLPRLRELQKRLAADDIRVIHVTTAGPMGLAGRYLGHLTRLPLVGSIHRSLVAEPSSAPSPHSIGAIHSRWRASSTSRYLRWFYGDCLRVLVPSADALHRLGADRWNLDRLIVWPGGADSDTFSPARRSDRLRNEWHVSDKRPAILCVMPAAGESELNHVEALGSLLYRNGIAHRFIVVGDGAALPRVRERCPAAVYLGRLSHHDLATVMASADLFFLPQASMTGGLTLLEAQASGLPVLVMGEGSVREYMKPGLSGIVCRPGDIVGSAARAAELLTDAGCRRGMGDAGRRYAQSRSWPSSLERVYALYRDATRPGSLAVRISQARTAVRTARAQR
jgi:glycosyltransferase involved in cell wall biosynthesis